MKSEFTTDQLLDHIRDNPGATLQEIRDALGAKNTKSIWARLSHRVKKGEVIKTDTVPTGFKLKED